MEKAALFMTIGELSRQTGCKPETIRFYGEIGLLPAPVRTEGNQRRYDHDSLQRLTFIRHARAMGFDIDDIRELLTLAADTTHSCHDVDAIAQRHLERVQKKIAQLKRLEDELERITHSCRHGTVGQCQIIETLSDHTKCHSAHGEA